MKIRRREVFPSPLFTGLLGHIFVSVPLLLYVLSTIDGRIVFYVLFFSFQLYVCTLVCLALLIHEEAISPLVIRLLRLFSVFCWGGICFMVYALVGSIVFTRIQRGPFHPKASPAVIVACTVLPCPLFSISVPEKSHFFSGGERRFRSAGAWPTARRRRTHVPGGKLRRQRRPEFAGYSVEAGKRAAGCISGVVSGAIRLFQARDAAAGGRYEGAAHDSRPFLLVNAAGRVIPAAFFCFPG